MCGIAGIFNYRDPSRPVDVGLLTSMASVLAHRGPDDEGFHVDGPIGLANRRLAIVDLTPSGHQPMGTRDGKCWLTYNGEFYDHRKFREQLTNNGHSFRGTSDTETMLALLSDRGPDALAEVTAIFGLAFWDGRTNTLTLARDPLGVKQLYYYDDGKRVIFGSEIKALLEADDLSRRPDFEGINQYLHFHTTLFDRTFFDGVRQLRAGEYLAIDVNGLHRRTYWSVEEFGTAESDSQVRVQELKSLLAEVVSDQLLADVEVGSFFSGGIDSSTVAAYATKAGQPPRCFGVHFTDPSVVDERPFQEAAAKALGLELQLITLDGSAFEQDLFTLLYYQDQPTIGAAMFPMHAVSSLAASQVKVCLGGQGADELFGGYARYALAELWPTIRSSLGIRLSKDGATDIVGGNLRKQLGRVSTIRRLAKALAKLGDWRGRYFDHFANVGEADWRAVIDPAIVSRPACRQVFEDVLKQSGAKRPGDKAMHWDMQTYLPGLFHQDDRMSMANSLESRVPLADPRLVRFAFRSSLDDKIRSGSSKWMLRAAVADVLPESVLNRPKVGFDTPAASWMRTRHAAFVSELLLSERTRDRGLFDMTGVRSLLERPSRSDWFPIAWKLINIEVWARVFLDGERPHGARSSATHGRISRLLADRR